MGPAVLVDASPAPLQMMASLVSARVIHQAHSALVSTADFVLCGFMCHASAPDGEDELPAPRHISRSIHCETSRWFSVIQLHGKPTSTWSARVLKDLKFAGYSPRTRLDDEILVQRELWRAADLLTEVKFLQSLGVEARAEHWRRRPCRTTPKFVQRRPGTILRYLRHMASAPVEWDMAVIGFASDRLTLSIDGSSYSLCVRVHLVLRHQSKPHSNVQLVVRHENREPLPSRITEALRGGLAGTGCKIKSDGDSLLAWVDLDGLSATTRKASKVLSEATAALHRCL